MSLSAAHNDGGIGYQLPPRLLRFSLLYPHRPILIPSLDIDPYLNLDARRVGQFPSKACLLQQFGSIQAPATEQALQRRQPIGPCRGENVPIPHYHGDVLQERQPRPWRRHLQQDFRAWALSAELSSLEEHVPQVHQTRRALDEGIVEGDQSYRASTFSKPQWTMIERTQRALATPMMQNQVRWYLVETSKVFLV